MYLSLAVWITVPLEQLKHLHGLTAISWEVILTPCSGTIKKSV